MHINRLAARSGAAIALLAITLGAAPASATTVPVDSSAPDDTEAADGSAATDGSAAPAAELGDKISIGVGIDAAYAPFFVAEAEGIFEKYGLTDVELVQFSRGGEAVDALGAGQVQLAGNSDTTTLVTMGNNPMFQALSIYQESGEYLKVVLGGDIETTADIETMGVVPGLSEYNTDLFVESEGLEGVEYVQAAPTEMPAILQRGDIDAYILWEPWPTQGVELGGTIWGNTGDFGSSYVHWLVTTNDWIGEGDHADYAVAVNRALTEASEFVEAEPERTAEITEEAVQIPQADTITAIEQIDFGVRGFDEDDFASYERQIEYLLDREMVANAPDLEAVINTEFESATEGG